MTASLHSRRMFLARVSALCTAAASPLSMATAASDDTGFTARTAVQWSRIRRALSPQTMAQCRKAAANLAPRMRALLLAKDWESQTLNAIVAELKAVGAFPVDHKPLDPKCAAEADRLRGDAQDSQSRYAAVSAALAAAAAVAATTPVVGPIIAAILLLIAAVIILIGQIMAKALEDQAAAKEKRAGAKEMQAEREKEEKEAEERRRRVEEYLVIELERRPNCELVLKKKD